MQEHEGIGSSGTQNGITRRRLLDFLLTAGALGFIASVLYPVIRYLNPPPQAEAEESSVKVGRIGDLAKNSGKIFAFNNKPGILVNTVKGELKAFSAVCTHLECTVQYRSDIEQIWCACHNGHYDLSGRNIAGPPPRPLEQYQVNVKGDDVFVSKKS